MIKIHPLFAAFLCLSSVGVRPRKKDFFFFLQILTGGKYSA